MRPALALLSVALAAACGSLPDSGDGVVSLQVTSPTTLTLPIGRTITLHAVALDIQGDAVPSAMIYWRTPDTALVTLDSVAGTVIARTNSGSARFQARVGTLLSDPIALTLSDTTVTSLRARR
jgi:hypothetical protein